MPQPDLLLIRSWEVYSAWGASNASRARDLSYETVEEAVLSWSRAKRAKTPDEFQFYTRRHRELAQRLPADLRAYLFPPDYD